MPVGLLCVWGHLIVLIFVANTMSLGLEYLILLCSEETVLKNLQQLIKQIHSQTFWFKKEMHCCII